MIIIADTESIKELIGAKPSGRVIVLCRDGEQFTADAVQAMLSVHAEMETIPDSASLSFAFGVIAGRTGKPNDITILSNDGNIKSAAEAFGFSVKLPLQKPRGRAKAAGQTVRKKAVKTGPSASTGSAAEKKAESEIPDNFKVILSKANVDPADVKDVFTAIRKSANDLTYELQLRMTLLNKEKAADIYAKTSADYGKLKKIAGDMQTAD